LVYANFIEHAKIVALSGTAYAEVLRGVAKEAVGGGRAYDAVIAKCASRAKAETLLTFNRRHFDPPPAGVLVVEPSPVG
jgi:hypothetical protein